MKTVFLICHSDGQTGALDLLEYYITKKGYRLCRLLHPLDDYSKMQSSLLVNGELIDIRRCEEGFIINHLKDTYLSVRFLLKYQPNFIIGASNFDALPAIIYKFLFLKFTTKIIYYPRDYSVDRFSNRFLNLAYSMVEKIAVKFSSFTISNTIRAESARINHGLRKRRSLIIPNPVNLMKPIFKDRPINKQHFIYIGDVNNEHGLLSLISEIAPIIKRLTIIGGGSDWDRVLFLAKQRQIEVEAYHRVSKKFVHNYLKKFEGIGLAPYNMSSGWTYYCSPLKVSEYIASGVPVLMSNVPEVAEKVHAEKLGVVYSKLSLGEIKRTIDEFDVSDYARKAEMFYQETNVDACFKALPL